jgi:drug/metabolite transporter (DMT)-like permease
MNWLLRLYPARWRERYAEEFGVVLTSQRASVGLILDVLAGAVDAHLHPQDQISNLKQGDDTMTLEMLQRCAAGGPKLSPRDKRIASISMIVSALALAVLYIGLTKTYHAAPAVEALFYASFPALALIYEQTAYLRKRSRLTQTFVLVAGFSAIYLVILAAFVFGGKW